jgi:hypothetical protein
MRNSMEICMPWIVLKNGGALWEYGSEQRIKKKGTEQRTQI